MNIIIVKKLIPVIACCALVAGCKTSTSQSTDAFGDPVTVTTRTIDPQRTATAIKVILPTAVRLAVTKQPEAKEYIQKAQIAVCAVAASGNLSPEQLKSAVAATGIKEIRTPEAQVAIEAIYGIYQAYFADVVANKLDQTEWLVPVLEAICEGLGSGLEPVYTGVAAQ